MAFLRFFIEKAAFLWFCRFCATLFTMTMNNRRFQSAGLRAFLPLIFGSFLWFNGIWAGDSCVIDVSCSSSSWKSSIAQIVPQKIVLAKVSFNSDVPISTHEFLYLTEFYEGRTVDRAAIERALERLCEKKVFEHIKLELTNHGSSTDVQCTLEGLWRLSKLKFHGMLIGKETYRQYYLMEPGDPFDDTKHARSLGRIIQAFKENGYFQGTVQDRVVRDPVSKTVTSHLSLWRGARFKIGSIVVASAHETTEAEHATELDHVRHIVHKKLERKWYATELITAELESIKRFLSSKGFLHVGITLSEKIRKKAQTVDLTLTFDFLEKRQFVFFGNAFFTEDYLLDLLLSMGDAVHMIPAPILAEDIEKEYHKKGFWVVHIETKEEHGRDFFIINEGQRCVLEHVEFMGVQVFDPAFFEHKFFKPLLRINSFDQDLFDDRLGQLIAWYQSHGYVNVDIVKCERVKLPGDSEHYSMRVTVREGNQIMLSTVTIPGHEELMQQSWFASFLQRTVGQPFDPVCLEEQREWLRRYFRIQGYPHAIVKFDTEQIGNTVNVAWHVDKGLPAPFFGKTILQGCTSVPFDVIEKSLAHHEGAVWDDAQLKTSADRLRKLGIFESVSVYPSKTAFDDQSKDVLLKLYQDDPFEVRFRSGLGLQAVDRYFNFERGLTYKVGGTFLFKSPTRAGDCFMLDGDIARSMNHLDVEYDRPHLFGIPSPTRIKGYLSTYEQPGFVGSKKDLYDISQQGFLIGVREKWRSCDLGLNLGCEWMKTSMKKDSAKLACQMACAIHFKPALLGKKLPYFFMEPVIVLDRLDEKMNPTFGTFTLCTMKGMLSLCDCWQDASFVKLMGEHSMFYPLTPFLVGAFHVRLGHIFFQKFQDIMPFERFYLGGANSIRSYEADLCPPICSFKDDAGNCYTVPQGGKTMAHINVELRFPVWKNIKGVVFQDLGTLIGQSFSDFDYSRLLAATGFGVRYNTPIGPLRFDIGWKWRLSHPHDYAYSWFLALGHAF
jgi:outer membrane protein assembly factor BamA